MKNVIIPAALVGSASAFPAVFDLDAGKNLLVGGAVNLARVAECGNKGTFMAAAGNTNDQTYFAGTVGAVSVSGSPLNKLRNWCETGNAAVEPVAGKTKFCDFVEGGTVLDANGQRTTQGTPTCTGTASEAMDLVYYSFAGAAPGITTTAITLTTDSISGTNGQANAYLPALGKAGSCREKASLAAGDANKTACEATAQNGGVCKWDASADAGSRCLVDTTLQSTWTFTEVKDLTGEQKQAIQLRLEALTPDELMQYAHEGIHNMATKPTNYPNAADISAHPPASADEATAINDALKPVCEGFGGTYTAAAFTGGVVNVACAETWDAPTTSTTGITDAQMAAAVDLVCQKAGATFEADSDVAAVFADINAAQPPATALTAASLKQDYCNDLTKFLGTTTMPQFPATSNTAETQRVQNISLCKYTANTANVNASTALDNECKAYAAATTTTSSASSVSALSATAAIAAGVMFAQ